jgi:hypothetical protein
MRNSDTKPRPHFRAESRFYQQDGQWFYSTREGEHGPFASRHDAEADARLYAGLHAHLEQVRDRTRGSSAG